MEAGEMQEAGVATWWARAAATAAAAALAFSLTGASLGWSEVGRITNFKYHSSIVTQ